MILFQISSHGKECFQLGSESIWIPQLISMTVISTADPYLIPDKWPTPSGTTFTLGTEIWTFTHLKGSIKKWTDSAGWISNKGRNKTKIKQLIPLRTEPEPTHTLDQTPDTSHGCCFAAVAAQDLVISQFCF